MKKFLCLAFLSLLFITSCSIGLDDVKATGLIKETLNLTEKDTIKILGISEESETSVIVKSDINKNTVNVKIRKYDKGWQLEEVQDAMGSWLPAASFKTFLGLDEKIKNEKLKAAIADIDTIAAVLVNYITDGRTPPVQNGRYDENSPFYKSLCPDYAAEIPIKDPWGNHYLVYCGTSCKGIYGISGASADDVLIVSLGSDGQKETWTYDPAVPESGLFIDGDSSEDLVNYSGSWIRASGAMVNSF